MISIESNAVIILSSPTPFTVHIIRYGVSIEHHKSVVGVILEVAVGSRDYVTCYIVAERFGRNDRIVAEALYGSHSYLT